MDWILIDFSDQRLVERYDRLFECCPNAFIQQSTYWSNCIKDLSPDRPLFLLLSDGGRDVAALPLYLYENDLGNILTSVPHPGPLGGVFCREDLSVEEKEEIYKVLLTKAVEIAEHHNCLSLTLITNPFQDDFYFYEKHFSPTFILENFTQYIPMNETVHRSHGHRNRLNKAKGKGWLIGDCENLEEFDAWYSLHQKRHREVGAIPLDYLFLKNLFERLIPREKARLILVKNQKEILSGGFYVYHRNIMDVLMLSFNSEFSSSGANLLNTDYSIQWAKTSGVTIYNWQSSQDRLGGVYHYKQQWGSKERPYYFVTKLLCDPRKIQRIGLEDLKRRYRWHYVVPFGVFKEGFDRKYFKKE